MTNHTILTPEQLVQSFQEKFSTDITNPRIERRTSGIKKIEFVHIWMNVSNNAFKDAIKHLISLHPSPHFAVASGYDLGDTIELVYHFSLYYGLTHKEISLNMTVPLPKTNPVIDTITDLIPGALISEQEKQEMLGVVVKGIPTNTRVFISDDFPENMYPWRRDETGPASQVRNLHEVKK